MSEFNGATLMIAGATGSFGNTVLKHFLEGVFSIGHDPVCELGWHSVYGQVGRRKLGHDPYRHGRFTAIADGGIMALIDYT